MSKNFVVEMVQKNWYLVAAFVVLMGGAVYMSGGSDSSGADAVVDPNASTTVTTTSTRAVNPAATAANPWKGLSTQEKARTTIREYENKFAADPGAERSAADLSALGNLHYSKLGEYTQAAVYYEELLKNYPKWMGNNVAYPNLASCYDRLDQKDLARYTYERMLTYFPSDTEHYAYAKHKLGR